MTDNELRGLLLRWYYERRREHWVKPTLEDFDVEIEERNIGDVTGQLDEHELVGWAYPEAANTQPDLRGAQIPVTDIDVVEGTSIAPSSSTRGA